MSVRCPKCNGMLCRETEYLAEDGKLDTVKCVNCGHRISRPFHAATTQKKDETMKKETTPSTAAEPPKKRSCHECGRDMPLIGRGLCGKCYYHKVQKPAGKKTGPPRKKKGNQGTPPCACCGRPGLKLPARGLCARCWNKLKAEGTLDERFPRRNKHQAKAAAEKHPAEPATESAPAELPATRAEPAAPAVDLPVAVDFSGERERQLYAALVEAADKERRSVDQQLLRILEEALFVQ